MRCALLIHKGAARWAARGAEAGVPEPSARCAAGFFRGTSYCFGYHHGLARCSRAWLAHMSLRRNMSDVADVGEGRAVGCDLWAVLLQLGRAVVACGGVAVMCCMCGWRTEGS